MLQVFHATFHAHGWVAIALALVLLSGCDRGQEVSLTESDRFASESDLNGDLALPTPPPPLPPRPPSGTIPLPEFNPLDVEGNLHVTGSDTIAPIVELLYERFIEEGYAGLMKIDAIGSGAGFKLYCDEGKADISMSSRAIKADETQRCRDNGRTPAEFEIGKDAVVIVVHPDNDWLENTALEQLQTLFTAEKWSDVNADWPDEPIVRFVPDINSGTLDIFANRVGIDDRQDIVNALNTTFSADVEDLAEGVAATPYAISFFSYAYYQEYSDELRAIAIEGVEATASSVASGAYPFSRPLYIYVDTQTLQQKAQVEAFVSFFLHHVSETLGQTGYFPADPTTLDRASTRFYEIMGYSLP